MSQKAAPLIPWENLTAEKWVEYRPDIEKHLATLKRISDFAFSQDTDVAIGIQRIWYPPEVCGECGKTNDFVMELNCDCWQIPEELEGENK
jgi:hypothetical protein